MDKCSNVRVGFIALKDRNRYRNKYRYEYTYDNSVAMFTSKPHYDNSVAMFTSKPHYLGF